MRLRKSLKCFGIVAVMVAILSGCPFAGIGGLDRNSCYLKLSIKPGIAPKSIVVSEIAVNGLGIGIYNSSEELVQSIDWDLLDGPQEYRLVFDKAGEYELVVTHKGDGVEVTESDAFSLKAMKITKISIVPGLVGMIAVEDNNSGPDVGEWILGTWAGDIDFPGLDSAYLEAFYGADGTCTSLIYYYAGGLLVDDTSMRGTYEVDGLTLMQHFTEMYDSEGWHEINPIDTTTVFDESAVGQDFFISEPDFGDGVLRTWTLTKQ